MGQVEEVTYQLNLRDLLTGKLKEADTQAKVLETTMGGVKSVLSTLGVGFAIFEGAEYIKGGIEKVHEYHAALAQIEAGLKSTGEAAGLTAEEIDTMASKMANNIKYSKNEILTMQSVLLTFPSVTKETFGEASEVIGDLATRLGTDLKGAAIQVGKALQDPERGLTALRRVGVNFSDEQKDVIEKLVSTNQLAKAQGIILKELALEFGGSAKAAFNADPLARFNKVMGSVQKQVGEAAASILEDLSPALVDVAYGLQTAAGYVKDFVGFLRENKDIAIFVAETIGVAVTVYGAYSLATWGATKAQLAYNTALAVGEFIMTAGVPIIAALAAGEGVITAAQWGLNAAMEANPVGVFIVAVGALIGTLVYLYNHFETARGAIWAFGSVLKEVFSIIYDQADGLYHILKGVFTLDWHEVETGASKLIDATTNQFQRIGEAAVAGYQKGVGNFNGVSAVIGGMPDEQGHLFAGLQPAAKKTEPVKTKTDTGVSKATPNKAITINISIGNLIKEFKINTTNITETANKVHDHVANALLDAVNDAGLVANL
jgi:hypothetical protein